jgi:hypothetical protein
MRRFNVCKIQEQHPTLGFFLGIAVSGCDDLDESEDVFVSLEKYKAIPIGDEVLQAT